MDFVIRTATPEDTYRLVEMKRQIFGERHASAAHWDHQYFGAPWGNLTSGVAEADGTIAAASCRICRRLKVGDLTTLSAQGGDSMVLPEFRGHRVAEEIAEFTLREAIASGAAFAYGFPNPRKGLRFLIPLRGAFRVPYYGRAIRPRDALDLFPAGRLHRRLLAWAALGVSRRIPIRAPGRLQFSLSTHLPEGIDGLWEQSQHIAPLQHVRDAEYLRWRYADNPVRDYQFLSARRKGRLVGLMVLAEEEHHGTRLLLAMDWLLERRRSRVYEALLKEAGRIAARTPGVAMLLIAALPPFGRRAMWQGFLPVPKAMAPSEMFFCVFKPIHAGFDYEELRRRENWFMTMGDSDVF